MYQYVYVVSTGSSWLSLLLTYWANLILYYLDLVDGEA